MVGHASSGLDDAQEQQQQHVVDVDFGWICTKLYEHRASLNEIVDCSKQLREQVVVQHSNVDAASAAWSPTQTTAFERHVWRSENRRPGGGAEKKEEDAVQHFLHRLETNGYAIVDCHNNTDATAHHHHHHDDPLPVSSWHTTSRQQDQLSQYYLDQASRQGRSVRTDRVHFLSRAQAQTCGILDQYELLLGLAHFLNDNHHHQITSHNNNNNDPDGILHPIASSPYWQPVRPATTQRPLTLPRSVQFAEYGCGDYYVVRLCVCKRMLQCLLAY